MNKMKSETQTKENVAYTHTQRDVCMCTYAQKKM